MFKFFSKLRVDTIKKFSLEIILIKNGEKCQEKKRQYYPQYLRGLNN